MTQVEDSGAAVGSEDAAVSASEASEEAPAIEAKDDAKSDAEDQDNEDIDYEALLMADEADAKAETPSKDADKQDASKAAEGTHVSFDARLKQLKEIAEKLESTPEDGNDNYKHLRKLANTLTKTRLEEVEKLQQLEAFGGIDRVKDALAMHDGLFGYDTELGIPSTHEFAKSFAEKDAESAFNLALNLLNNKASDGRTFAEHFTEKTLKIDPTRIADFQAISRGEVPEAYKDFVDSSEDLEAVPPEFRDAFKSLSPRVKDIVLDGLDRHATAAEKAEAQRLLSDRQDKLNEAAQKAAKTEQARIQESQRVYEKAIEVEQNSFQSVGTRIWQSLDKLSFSSDPALDVTIKHGIGNQLFHLTDPSPYIRGRAEAYFKEMGIEIDRSRIDYWKDRLGKNIDIEAMASVKGQKTVAEEAHRARVEAEKHLAAMAVQFIVQAARKTKAGAAQAKAVKLPENELPAAKRAGVSSSSTKGKALSWQDVMAANKAGKQLAIQ